MNRNKKEPIVITPEQRKKVILKIAQHLDARKRKWAEEEFERLAKEENEKDGKKNKDYRSGGVPPIVIG